VRDLLTALVDELRSVGIGVSVGEHLDAASAVSRISVLDKDVLRATLQCALIKNADHLSAFNLIFELCTSGAPATGEGPLAALSDEELRATLRGAGNFAAADAIREALAGAGLDISDTPDGTRWQPAETP